MTTLDAFAQPAPTSLRGPRCSVGRIVATLTDDSPLHRLPDVLDPESGWESSQIAAVLAEHGHSVKAITVARHRRRALGNGCSCP